MGRSSKGYLAVAAAAAFVGVGSARAADPTTEQLMQQIQDLQSKVQRVNELEAKVQQLEARQNQQQAVSAAQVDATVERVLADAEKRSQLLQMEGFTAGYSKGKFLIQDAAGNYVLQPNFQLQIRSVTNFRDGADDSDDDTQNGFEIRRLKFGFKGNAITPKLTYNFRWATDRDGGSPILDNGFVQYQLNDSFAIKGGQWKDNVFHEETTSSGSQLAVDRSLLNELLAGGQTDYVQGVSVIWETKDQPFRAEVALHDGLDTDNTEFLEHEGGSLGMAPNWGVSARVEYLAMGTWKQYEDFTALGNKDSLLVIGGGLEYSEDGGFTSLHHTVDAQYETAGGLGLYGGFIGLCRDFGDDGGSLYDWGILVQAGYMLNQRWEVFGRWDYTNFDDGSLDAGLAQEYCEITVGTNWYVGGGHAAKFTLDLTYLPNGSPSNVTGIGVLESQDDQWLLRGQFQLLL